MKSLQTSASAARESGQDSRATRSIRALIWVYILMLLFEGAFRKWITPGLSSPLLIVRDPVVIVIYLIALAGGIFPTNRFIYSLAAIAVLAGLFGLFAAQFSPFVYLFGLRTNYLHLPLIFVIARVMKHHDVERVGFWWLVMAVPMSILILKQFEGGDQSILNIAAGGAGFQLGTSGGKLRASGTFSFVSGLVSFCGMTAAFLLNSLVSKKSYPLWLKLAGAASLVASVSASGSRSAVGAIVAVTVVGLCAVVLKPDLLMRILVAFAAIGVVWAALFQVSAVKEGTSVMSMRFEEAGGQKGVWPRLFESFYGPLARVFDAPFFGGGLGRGTNAGAALATGKADFGMGEDEWSRLLLESGPLAGLLFIGWRVALVIYLARISARSLKLGNVLPIFLLGANGLTILNGQLGQPTALGFAALGGGLCLAAAIGYAPANSSSEDPVAPRQETNSTPKQRGRSPYAEALHRDD